MTLFCAIVVWFFYGLNTLVGRSEMSGMEKVRVMALNFRIAMLTVAFLTGYVFTELYFTVQRFL